MKTLIGIMRFDQLHPPFDDPAIRRALLGAVDQAAAMQAVAGTDPAGWRDRIGLFDPEAPLGNDAGIEVLELPRDYAKVRLELTAAGYHGERIIALDLADVSGVHALALVGVDALRQSGMDVDVQSMDAGTWVRRRDSKQPIQQGGWNVFFTFMDSTVNFTPAGNVALRGNGVDGWAGWPTSPRLWTQRSAFVGSCNCSSGGTCPTYRWAVFAADLLPADIGRCAKRTPAVFWSASSVSNMVGASPRDARDVSDGEQKMVGSRGHWFILLGNHSSASRLQLCTS